MAGACEFVRLASDAAFAVDGGLRVIAWNGRAGELLGYAPKEVIGKPCCEVLQAVLPSGAPLCTPTCEGRLCFQSCRPFAVPSCRARHKNGDWIVLSLGTVVMPREARTQSRGGDLAVVFLRAQQETPLHAQPDRRLRVSTFGRFALTVDGRRLPVEKWERKQALTLLKYLVSRPGRAVHRDWLIEYLWPGADTKRGFERLKVTVYFLRQQLRAAGMHEGVVETVGPSYLLQRETTWVDAEAFESFACEGLALEARQRPDEALRRFESARQLYRGDYLEEDLYTDWCAVERERLRELYLETLGHMAKNYAIRGEFSRATQLCRTALACEPSRESFHRALMEYLVSLGRPDCAVAQFHRCCGVLAHELGVEPMAETQRLYRELLASSGAGGTKTPAGQPE